MPACSVNNCGNHNQKTKSVNIRYFRFPKDPNLRAQWIKACNREKININNARICSFHFTNECYEKKADHLIVPGDKDIFVLSKTAMPTLNLNLDDKSLGRRKKNLGPNENEWNASSRNNQNTNDMNLAQGVQAAQMQRAVYAMQPNAYSAQDIQRQQMAAAMQYSHLYGRYQAPAQQVQQQLHNFPVHPDVKFKVLPFYDHITDLVKPSSLLPTTANNRMQEIPFTFYLTPQQATEIATNRDLRPAAKIDYVIQVQLRFCQLDSTTEQEDFFPPGIIVKVNGKVAQLPSPIPSNRQGAEPKRPPKPVNITSLVKLSPTVSNTIHVTWMSDFAKGYVVRVSLVKKLTAQQLLQRLKSKGIKHADYTTGLIKEKLSDDADSEISTTSVKVSLLCPLGKFRMNVPCRATTCNHLRCFDALVYLEMNEKRATWICPVCDKPALYDNLVIDGYFQEALNSPKLPSGINEIELHKDGSWQVNIAPKKESMAVSSSNDMDDSVEIISDDLEIVNVSGASSINKITTIVDTTVSSMSSEPKAARPSVVDLTLSDSEEESEAENSLDNDTAYQKRKATSGGDVNGTGSQQKKLARGTTNAPTQYNSPTPGAAQSSNSVSSSGYQSPGVITLDSPSPPLD